MLVVHRTLALIVVLLALAGTLWAVHDWLRRDAIHPRLLTFTMAMSGVIGLQALFGILLAVTGNRPADGATHFAVGPLTCSCCRWHGASLPADRTEPRRRPSQWPGSCYCS